MQLHRVLGQARRAVATGDFVAENRADHAVDVPNRELHDDLFLLINRRFARFQQVRHVDGLLQAVVLRHLAVATHAVGHIGRVEDAGEVEAARLPMVGGLAGFEPVHAADHLGNGAEAELGHQLANFLRDEGHEVDHVLGLAGEEAAQLRVLRRDTDGAGVQMADAHHDAAHRHERASGEAKFLRAEQRRHDDVATGLQLAVRLNRDARAKVVQHERLVRLGKAELPRDARVLDGGLRRSAGAAVETGDKHDIRVRLGDARRDGADADFGNQLDADARAAVGVLEVVNQLREVFDGVDVVVRRRGNQTDTGR